MMSSLILCLQRPPRHCTGKPAKPTNVVRPKFLGIMRNATQFPVRTECQNGTAVSRGWRNTIALWRWIK